jgi:hypothetical protein
VSACCVARACSAAARATAQCAARRNRTQRAASRRTCLRNGTGKHLSRWRITKPTRASAIRCWAISPCPRATWSSVAWRPRMRRSPGRRALPPSRAATAALAQPLQAAAVAQIVSRLPSLPRRRLSRNRHNSSSKARRECEARPRCRSLRRPRVAALGGLLALVAGASRASIRRVHARSFDRSRALHV